MIRNARYLVPSLMGTPILGAGTPSGEDDGADAARTIEEMVLGPR